MGEDEKQKSRKQPKGEGAGQEPGRLGASERREDARCSPAPLVALADNRCNLASNAGESGEAKSRSSEANDAVFLSLSRQTTMHESRNTRIEGISEERNTVTKEDVQEVESDAWN